MNKKVLSIVISCLLIIGIGLSYFFVFYVPNQKAKDNFNNELSIVKNNTTRLEENIKLSKKTLKEKHPVYEKSTEEILKSKIKEAEKILSKIPTLPKKTKEIEKATDKLKSFPSVENIQSELDDSLNNYNKSIKQQKQITNPPSNSIISKIKKVKSISNTQAATEDNDTNGKLNKPGGYTAAIVFSTPLVKEDVYGTDLVDKGNDAGGTIEVYSSSEDANKRNEYLSSFDGASMLNPGSHTVLGTMVIRTSSYLTNSQQKELEKDLEEALTSL